MSTIAVPVIENLRPIDVPMIKNGPSMYLNDKKWPIDVPIKTGTPLHVPHFRKKRGPLMYLAAWFCDPCLRHIPITTFVLSTPPGILCTRIPLCHKFHELVDCIKTKLKIVTSMQFKLCTASWLEWGGGHSVQKCLQGCAANMGCKIKMVRFVGSLFFAKFGTKNYRICTKRA